VRRIYRMFTADKLGTYAIAKQLNDEGVPKPTGTKTSWHQTAIWKLMDSPIYAGKIRVGDKVAYPAEAGGERRWLNVTRHLTHLGLYTEISLEGTR